MQDPDGLEDGEIYLYIFIPMLLQSIVPYHIDTLFPLVLHQCCASLSLTHIYLYCLSELIFKKSITPNEGYTQKHKFHSIHHLGYM